MKDRLIAILVCLIILGFCILGCLITMSDKYEEEINDLRNKVKECEMIKNG